VADTFIHRLIDIFLIVYIHLTPFEATLPGALIATKAASRRKTT